MEMYWVTSVNKKGETKFHRDVYGKTDLLRVHLIYIVLVTVMISTELFYLTLICSLIGYFFEYLPLFFHYRFAVFP